MKTFIAKYERRNGTCVSMRVQADSIGAAISAAYGWVCGVLGCKLIEVRSCKSCKQ